MTHKLIKTGVCALLLLTNLSVGAESLVVPYKNFYNHTKKIDAEDTNALQFAFGFKLVQTETLCRINSAHIHTQKQTLPLSLINQTRFTVPTDKILKLARADVVIDLEQAANRCDMSVQLETKVEYLQQNYSREDLALLLEQYQQFFSGMGSFLAFMMPSAEGLILHFSDTEQPQSLPSGLQLEETKLRLSSQWIMENSGLQLDTTPLRITAMVVK